MVLILSTILLTLSSPVWAQTRAQDCATADLIWKKMGQTTTIPSTCCDTRHIACSLRRITGIFWESKSLKNSIPPEIGNLTGLTRLVLSNNQLSGSIPSTIGSLTNLQRLWVYGNQLTGYPSALLSLPNLNDRKLFPNPMSDVPYDVVAPASIGTLTNVTWAPFLNTPVTLRKRQTLSLSAPISTAELVNMCPLNNVQNADVAAGCVAGIYNRFCYNPADSTLLAQCHDAYNRVFSASFFKPLGDVCPAWRRGPFSASCANAIRSFSYNLLMGYDPLGNPVYLNLNSYHAGELVKNIFAQPKFAPCQAPATCTWVATAA